MSELDDLIRTVEKICSSLEDCAKNEKNFSDEICQIMHEYSNTTHKMACELKEIRYLVGG